MQVSVIIPIKNRRNIFPDTLDNILNQTLKPHEIIIVDDHSDDETYEWLKSLEYDNVIVLRNKGHGVGAARNTGLNAATGKYIKFFDSDDFMTLNTLEEQAKLLQRGYDLVYSPYVHVRKTKQGFIQQGPILQYKPIKKDKNWQKYLASGFFVIVPAFMFVKSIFHQENPWPQDSNIFEDWEFLWNIFDLKKLKITHTAKCAVFYTIHGNQSTTDTQIIEYSTNKIKILQRTLNKTTNITKKLLLKILIYKEEKQLQGKIQYDKNKQSKLIIRIFYLLYRIWHKTNRMITKTEWTLLHKPDKNTKHFEKYLELLKD